MATVGQLIDILESHRQQLCFIAGRYLPPADDPEDCVQESSIKALINLHTFRGDSALLSWLVRIVINSAKMRYRSYRGLTSLEEPIGDDITLGDTLIATEPLPGELLEKRRQRASTIEAIEKLPGHVRDDFKLRYRSGLMVKEICEITGRSPGTVKSHLSRGKKLLQERLTA